MATADSDLELVARYLCNRSLAVDLAQCEPVRPTKKDLIGGMIVLALTGDLALAEYYLIDRCRSRETIGSAIEIETMTLAYATRVLEDPVIGRAVARAMAAPSNGYRRTAEKFIVNGMLAKFILEQCQKGVVMSTSAAIDVYLLMWSEREPPPETRKWLQTLMSEKYRRRDFAASMRAQWRLHYGMLQERRSNDDGDTEGKVPSPPPSPPQGDRLSRSMWVCASGDGLPWSGLT